LGLFTVQTRCSSKDEYLTRPDLGAQFDDEAITEINKRCEAKPQVQIYVSDGLSSTAVEANVRDLLPALQQGLKLHGLGVGTPFFVKYGRVRSMEPISEALGSTVTCVLLGERPGLATPESLSAYLAYQARVGMPESERNCVSNIHQEGTNPVEAGAHIADLINAMVKQQASGIKLKTG
ncbi:MAG TPA: ethanolamine ammonia-lyase subunit EutC, partial [Propionibacterium sp.]|nr:ethanolamine ammonia-lyase subunit EutC [Propionibacterium sp.]